MTFDGSTDGPAESRRSLFQLIGSLPGLVGDLIRAELEAIKADLKQKAIRAAVGAALLVAAAFVLLLSLIVFIIAAIAGLATVLPFWASALIIGGGLVLIAVVLGFAGVASFKSTKPVSEPTIGNLDADIRLLSREGRRDARAAERGEV